MYESKEAEIQNRNNEMLHCAKSDNANHHRTFAIMPARPPQTMRLVMSAAPLLPLTSVGGCIGFVGFDIIA